MDEDIVRRLDGLVFEEHHLQQRFANRELLTADERQRMMELEVRLDQCWELLRQRRASADQFNENIVDIRTNVPQDY